MTLWWLVSRIWHAISASADVSSTSAIAIAISLETGDCVLICSSTLASIVYSDAFLRLQDYQSEVEKGI